MRRIPDLHRGQRVGQRNSRPAAGLELLEPRQLLSSVAAGSPVPFYNLTGALLPTALPPEMAGQPLQGTLSLAVKNAGNLVLPPSQQVTIKFIAHGTSGDVTLGTSKAQNVSKLKAGDTKTFTFDLKKAASVPAGDYTIEALITPTPVLTESSTNDNLVTTTAAHKTIALHVIMPDITGTLGISTLPGAILSTSQNPVPGALTVLVKNDGRIALPDHEQITLQIKAHNTTTGKDYVLNSNPGQKFLVSGLGIGQSIAIAPNLHFTGKTLPAGIYQFEALITPVQALPERDTTNNLVTLNAAGEAVTLTSLATAVADLTGIFANSTVKSTPNATIGNLNIKLTNTGTAAIVGTQPVSFTITAQLEGGGPTIQLATASQNFSVKNLKVGQSATFVVTVNDGILAAGTYDLLAGITATGLNGPTSDNIVSQNKAGNAVTVTSTNQSLTLGTDGIVDLTNLSTVLNNFGAANSTWTSANFDGSSTINLTDLAAILNNFGNLTAASPSNATITGGNSITLLPVNPANGTLVVDPGTGTTNLNGGSTTISGTGAGILNLGGSNTTIETVSISAFSTLFTSNGTSLSQVTMDNASATSVSTDGQSNQTLPFDAATLSNSNGTVQFSNLTLGGAPANVDLTATLAASSKLTIQGTVSGTQYTITFTPGATAGAGTVTVNGGMYWNYTVTNSDPGTLAVTLNPTLIGLPGGTSGVLTINSGIFDLSNNKLILTSQDPSSGKATFTTYPVTSGSIAVVYQSSGDGNVDGRVDLTDLSTVLKNFGTTTSAWTTGNFDGSATIDLTDLAAILNKFGLSNPGSSGTPTASGSSPTSDNTTPAT